MADNIEAMVASPPHRNELVVQLFVRDGGQWGEVFVEGGEYWIDLYLAAGEPPLRFGVGEVISALTRSVDELRRRFEVPR
jgi:hypothetical protein